MIKKSGLFNILALLLLLTACTSETDITNQDSKDTMQQHESDPVITRVQTNFSEKEGWVVVPASTQEILVTVEASNAETLLFWSVPTGTDTWKERRLVGYDTNGEDGWKVTWDTGGQSLHNHLVIQALGSDGKTIASETINVTNE